MTECLYVVYHNFHSLKNTDYYNFKGVEEDQFKKQIEFLCNNYEPLTMDLLKKCLKNKKALPERSFYLTFDDGYKDQILFAIFQLRNFNLKGSFFINTKKLEEKKLLTVDKQRFLQYGTGEFSEFLKSYCAAINELYPKIYNENFEPTEKNISQASDFYDEFEFYSNEERFYRKIRDTFLNEEQVERITENLFDKYFDNEASLVEKYFMNWDDLFLIKEYGMDIGGHSHTHPLLHRMRYKEQAQDIEKNISILKNKLDIEIYAFSYPYGSFNDDTIRILRRNRIDFGFMENGLIDRTELRDSYRLSRLGPEKICTL